MSRWRSAVAHFDHGTSEDVSAWTVFVATDPATVTLDASTRTATILRRGQHTIIARYLDRVIPIRIALPLSDVPVDHSREPIANFIDEHILRTLTDLRLTVSPVADDATYLRRVTLDLIGRLPTREETVAFLAGDGDASTRRRERVDRLLESDTFAKYWTYHVLNLLRVVPTPNDRHAAQAYHTWMLQQIRNRVPMNQIARELLTAVGDTHQVGPANFSRSSPDARRRRSWSVATSWGFGPMRQLP